MASAFDPCGVVTLLTDFGHKGVYVASMKGVILRRFRGATIVDISHESQVHWPPEAGFWLERSFGYFPRGTVHVAVVDPGVGTARDIVVATCEGHAILAPDNGLLAPLLDRHQEITVHRLDLLRVGGLGLPKASATFHGRDIFAPLGAELASGKVAPDKLGPRIDPRDVVPGWVEQARVDGNTIKGVVITFDHFGNIITNIEGHLLEQLDNPTVSICGQQLPVHRTYGEVTPGEYLALVNSFGMLEVARAEASAHAGLGSERGSPVVVRGS